MASTHYSVYLPEVLVPCLQIIRAQSLKTVENIFCPHCHRLTAGQNPGSQTNSISVKCLGGHSVKVNI